MLSFKKYTEEFDSIFDVTLRENESEIKFSETKVPVARGKMTIRSHQQNVAGKNVGISINSTVAPQSNHRQHKIAFSVDGEASRGDVGSESGMKVLRHVGRAVSAFHNQNTTLRPGRHSYNINAEDSNPKIQAKKSRVYKQFMKKFAKKIGGRYEHDKESDTHTVHYGE